MLILMILRLRIQHVKLVRASTSLPLSDFPRPILLSVWSLYALLIHHVSFDDGMLMLLLVTR